MNSQEERQDDHRNLHGRSGAFTIGDIFRRCEAARAAGGIALIDVIDKQTAIPADWVLDIQTQYYLPPNVELM